MTLLERFQRSTNVQARDLLIEVLLQLLDGTKYPEEIQRETGQPIKWCREVIELRGQLR